ncbi:hypothetical protein BIV57_06260 [Mangrovactinospora gilvigrisea]|uniref:Peptidase n=1 Tax=Mangrovactinospora gilvigrisea TaxID=1428644 RepID=A0A1J7BHZ3_9ACTN|nr:heme-binding protein [Mangrovactinospora gilvigrisea]OIV38270.1 hypothetical protein BIV57_06260 [Mangrovactinospora gilvigrisea]
MSAKHRISTRSKAVLGGAVGLGAVVAATVGGAAFAADDGTAATAAAAGNSGRVAAVRPAEQLTEAAAMKAATAALNKADQLNQHVTVAIVDRAGKTQLLVRGDGAGPQTQDSATRKAYTAVGWGQPTSKLNANAQGSGPSVRDIPNTLFVAGGVPVAHDNAPIAGIGVGGAPQGAIDEQIAKAGADAIAKDLR